MATSSIPARNSAVCSPSQVRTQPPERPGASPSSSPGPLVSALTNEVIHGSLGPRANRARRRRAPPDPLPPHQHRGPPADRDVAEQVFAPIVRLRRASALPTVDFCRNRLDEKFELTAVVAGREDNEAGQVNDRFRAATGSVTTHWGLL